MRKQYKKGMLIILVMLMVVGGFNGSFIGGEKAYADGVAFAGEGTSENPYQIATPDQLNEVRHHLEAGIYFKLTSHIDLSSYSADEGWLPIANSPSHFKGNFDGNGYTISNLAINRPTQNFVGLFGRVQSSNITNITLVNVNVRGKDSTGGLIGRNRGTISNSTVTGSVYGLGYSSGGLVGENFPGATITNSHSSASVSGGIYVGGLVGDNEGTISNSSASGSVDGVEFTGGLLGLSTGHINDSSATGSVSGGNETGGLVGSNRGPISSSFATGIVHGTTVVGGLTGSNDTTSSISSSYATGSVSGGNETGGLVGRNNGPISASFATGIVHGAADTGGLVGSNKGVINGSYATGNVSGTEDVGGLVGESMNTINTSYATGNVGGTEDVGGLVGANNHMIINSNATGHVTGLVASTGGLAGANFGAATINNSYAIGTVTGAVGAVYSGGLAGVNLGTIETSFAMGSVSGSSEVGGLVGRSQGDISNSYATGSVSGTTDAGGLVGRNLVASISNSYAIGSVNGTVDVGGLVGYNGNDGTINLSFYNSEISGHLNNKDRGVGKTTTEMKQTATFTGLDFDTIWVIEEGSTYPRLQSIVAEQQPDAAPPILVSATVEHAHPDQVVVAFDEKITISGTSGVTINVGGSSATITGAQHEVETNGITFTISDAILPGQEINISYDADSGSIKDLANNEAPGFTVPVINLVKTSFALVEQSGNAGEQIAVPLKLINDGTIVAIEFDLKFDPDFVTLNSLDNSYDEAIEYNEVSSGYYRVLIGSMGNTLIPEKVGNLNFTIAENKPHLANMDMTLSKIIATNTDGQTKTLENTVMIITVKDTVVPTLSLTPSTNDYAIGLDVEVTSNGTGSAIVSKKWAEGDVDLDTVKTSGTVFTGTSFPITANGTYTVYVEDEGGKGAITTVTIANIVVKGDVVGDKVGVDILDWQTVANFILLRSTPDARQSFAADMNDDGSINVGDWVMIANKIIK